ncbi:hypothetical protein D3C87_1918610 [compost metagenome]
MEAVVKEWSEETRFWRDISEEEEDERNKSLQAELTRLTRKKAGNNPTGNAQRKPIKIKKPRTTRT